jgi:hypothetical protein
MASNDNAQAVTRKLDGVVLIFRGYNGLWMIDRIAEPANERGDEEWIEEGSTAISVDEVWGMSEAQRRSYHARQLRKLGLSERGTGARVLWSMISDFDGFAP